MSERDIEVGARIKKVRQGKKMTQKELADKLKISQTAIALWENGSRSVSLDLIDDIARVLGVSAGFLLFGELDIKDNIQVSTSTAKTSLLDYVLQFLQLSDDDYDEDLDYLNDTDDEDVDNSHFSKLIDSYFKLNIIGQEKLIEYAQMLSKLSEYKK